MEYLGRKRRKIFQVQLQYIKINTNFSKICGKIRCQGEMYKMHLKSLLTYHAPS